MTNSSTTSENIDSTHAPTFRDAAAYWIKLGFISFGGPAGQIAMMQTECVDKRRWIGQGAFLRGLNYAMMLPGPEAQQLAAYIGWRLHGVKGAVFAGTMFVLPGMILMIALAWIAAKYGDQGAVAAILDGIKPVVVAIVIAAVYRIGSKTCKGPAALGLAIGAFAALQFGGVPFPVVVLGAGLIGVIVAKFMPNALAHGHGPDAAAEILGQTANGSGLGNFIKTSLIFAALWAGPSALMIALFGVQPFLDVIKLFTTAAFVTFGGAYAVLPYVADAGVNTYGWLTGAEMIDGLALAETTPGPTDLGHRLCRFFRRMVIGRRLAGCAHRPGHSLCHVFAVAVLDHRRRAVCGKHSTLRLGAQCAQRHHCRRGRRDLEPRYLFGARGVYRFQREYRLDRRHSRWRRLSVVGQWPRRNPADGRPRRSVRPRPLFHFLGGHDDCSPHQCCRT